MNELRFAVRTFGKRPGFTAVTVLTLALGIGATTAVFSIVQAVLLRPLPYKDPARLAAVWITSTREKGLAKLFATHADFLEFRRNSRTLESVSEATWAARTSRVMTGIGATREVLTIPASASFFETLGVSAATGRTFRAEDEAQACSLVLAHSFWKTALGGDRGIVGRSLTLDRQACTVVGVMPEDFSFYPGKTEAWILITPAIQPDLDKMLAGVFVRLKPGVSAAQAETELRGLYRAQHRDGEAREWQPVVYDLHGEFTFLAGRTLRTTLILVFGAVLLVLLIACLNVANLLLARVSERRREWAVRAALGSGQGRLVRQVLAEGLLLAGCGAALGVAIAWGAVQYFRAASPIELTAGANASVSLPVLLFSGALAIATTLLFGMLPALRASQVDLTQHLKAGGRGSIHGRQTLAKVVIAAEMAMSFLLLTGAGLLMASALRMGSEPLGFDPDHVLATRVALPVFRYATSDQRRRAYDQLLDRLERMAGAAGVALSSKLPPNAGGNQTLEVRGQSAEAGGELHVVGADAISPAFLTVLRIPLRRGRSFGTEDRESAQQVAIINDSLAQRYFPNSDPLGQQIRIPGGPMPWLTVVGVAGNLKHTELMNEMSWVESPILYRPLAQEPRQSVQVAVRPLGDGAGLAREMQREIAGLDSEIPVSEVEPVTARLAKTLAYPRFRAVVLGGFALGALLLSAVGLHGVLSQIVVQRTAEFGLRRAVGAQTRDVLLLVARQGGVPVLAGLVCGVCVMLGGDRVLRNLLYGIRPADAGAMAMVSVGLLAVAGAAMAMPAVRAARVDPMVALRDE